MTRHEVTGQRDLWLSRRHRTWGPAMFACDIDSISLECNAEMPMLYYYNRKPSYCIDYKAWDTSKPHDASTDTLTDWATNYRTAQHPRGLPMFVVLWKADHSHQGPANTQPMMFKPVPKNAEAERILNARLARGVPPAISERPYVKWLHELKGVQVPPEVLKQLSPVPITELIPSGAWKAAAL